MPDGWVIQRLGIRDGCQSSVVRFQSEKKQEWKFNRFSRCSSGEQEVRRRAPSGYTGLAALGRGSSAAVLHRLEVLPWIFIGAPPYPPMFFVNVASKGLRYCRKLFVCKHIGGCSEVVHLRDLDCTKNCANGTVGRAVDPEGNRPLCSRKECRIP